MIKKSMFYILIIVGFLFLVIYFTITAKVDNSYDLSNADNAVQDDANNPQRILELYLWKDPNITGNNEIHYSLFKQTGVVVNNDEIYDINNATTDIDDLNINISKYGDNTPMVITVLNLHEKNVTEEQLQNIFDKINLPESTLFVYHG